MSAQDVLGLVVAGGGALIAAVLALRGEAEGAFFVFLAAVLAAAWLVVP